MYQNEFKHNAFVAFNAILRIEKNETQWKRYTKLLNFTIILLTLLTFISTQNIIIQINSLTAIFAVLAFILSIVLIVFDKNFDTSLQNDLGDNYWRLYEETINLENKFLDKKITNDILNKNIDDISIQHQVLVSCSPSQNPIDHQKANEQMKDNDYCFRATDNKSLRL